MALQREQPHSAAHLETGHRYQCHTTLTWQTRDFRTMLRLSLVPRQGGGASANKEMLRERVELEFPDAVIRDEAECYTATDSGTGFELEQRNDQDSWVIRLAFVPYQGGMLELEITCPQEGEEQTRRHLTGVMNSLHIVPR